MAGTWLGYPAYAESKARRKQVANRIACQIWRFCRDNQKSLDSERAASYISLCLLDATRSVEQLNDQLHLTLKELQAKNKDAIAQIMQLRKVLKSMTELASDAGRKREAEVIQKRLQTKRGLDNLRAKPERKPKTQKIKPTMQELRRHK